MNHFDREPVAIIEGIKTVITLGISWAVIMGVWQLNDEQQTTTVLLAIAIVNVAGMVWQRSRVSPVYKGGKRANPDHA